jgi:uncharacterized protein (DUF2062 family)
MRSASLVTGPGRNASDRLLVRSRHHDEIGPVKQRCPLMLEASSEHTHRHRHAVADHQPTPIIIGPTMKIKKKASLWRHLTSPQLLINSLRKAYARFLKIRGKPREIALGMALGLFVGMTPFMGLHIVTAVFIAALLKWNKISAATGVWITNPLSAPFVYSINYFVGASILGKTNKYHWPTEGGFKAFIDMVLQAPEIIWAVLIGGVVLGIPLAVLGYYLSYYLVQRYQDEIRRKIAISKEKLARKKKLRRLKQLQKAGESHQNAPAGKPEPPPEN